MKIGIVGALEEELSAIRRRLDKVHVERKRRRTFHVGTIGPHTVVITRCDVGKVNGAIATQALIDHYDVDAVIEVGTAGALSPALELGDLVIASDVVQTDVDLTGWGLRRGEIMFDASIAEETGTLSFSTQFVFTPDEALAQVAIAAADKVSLQLVGTYPPETHYGRVLSSDRFVSDRAEVRSLMQEFNGLCADMEAAAVAQTCTLNDVPFLIISTISDRAGGSATADLRAFLLEATENYTRILVEMLENL